MWQSKPPDSFFDSQQRVLLEVIERSRRGEGDKLHTSREDSTICQGRNLKERVCHGPAASSRARVTSAFT